MLEELFPGPAGNALACSVPVNVTAGAGTVLWLSALTSLFHLFI